MNTLSNKQSTESKTKTYISANGGGNSTSIGVRIKTEQTSSTNHLKKSQTSTISQRNVRVGSTSSSIQNDDLIDSNSSSSDDTPLSQSSANSKKRCKSFLSTPTTKRKVEVLSKESGKIGVTIKTSPDGPPSNKILCTNVSATPITVPIKTEPAPLSPETPASHPESNTPPEKPSTSSTTNNKNNDVAVAAGAAVGSVDSHMVAFKSIHHGADGHESIQNNRLDNTQSDSVNSSKIANDLKLNKREPQTPTSPRPAPPRLWLHKNNLSDQVIITDVTVNKETVTIRECKKGFFPQPKI